MSNLYPEFFRRLDERPDALFYRRPRTKQHLDEAAAMKAKSLYEELLPPGGKILDLMTGRHSHLPEHVGHVTGLGLNLEELEANEDVDEPVICDVNQSETLPFEEGTFDGAVCTAAVQYMTRPGDTFSEVARCLKPGAPFIVTFSVRMFPSKAVLAWRASDDSAHLRLVASYFGKVGRFYPPQRRNFIPAKGDPLYCLWSTRS